jgi:hypothetical protein
VRGRRAYWLESYINNDTSEDFIRFSSQTNTLHTHTKVLRDEKTVTYSRDVCSFGVGKPEYSLQWEWDGTAALGWLDIHYPPCHGRKNDTDDFTGCVFHFTGVKRILATQPTPNVQNNIQIVQRSKDDTLRYFLADPSHPVHRFRKAIDSLVRLRGCRIEKSPFE